MKVNILVTGGCGFIGSQLVEELARIGAKVTVLDIFLDPQSIFVQHQLRKKVNLQFVDIRNREEVLKIFKKYKPSYVIHLAAESIVGKAYINPYSAFETNIMGTVNILDAVRLSKHVKGVIVASSDKAYGKSEKAYTEDFPLKGDHPYDVSKSCQDLIAQTYYKTYRLPIIITRFGNVYGEGDLNFGRIIPDICKAVILKKTLFVRSNGKYVRDYIYVGDVIKGYILLLKKLEKAKGEAFNFSSKDNLSVIDLINLAEKILKVKIPFKILDNVKNEIPNQHLNDKKVRKLGWKSTSTVRRKLAITLEWYEQLLYPYNNRKVPVKKF